MDDIINMRSSFVAVFKLLQALDFALDDEKADIKTFSHKKLKISETRWRKLLVMLQGAGYIEGVVIRDFGEDPISGDTDINIDVDDITITLKGLQYLAENSAFAKIRRILSGSIQVVSAVK